ncbi:MAG: type II toxin-antitoxin system Phd/YefM family antitoxin [Candidatus Thiodiazotropha endolucinida]|nr:type II toxin-antitoxin system Phd/YefM family antitoxin [Candidatus Thiodiazotropha endolucinida]
MLKVTSEEFQRNTGYYQDQALKEGVAITLNGRDHLVVIKAEEYYALRQHARTAMAAGEMSNADVQQLQDTHMSPEHDHLNTELNKAEAN